MSSINKVHPLLLFNATPNKLIQGKPLILQSKNPIIKANFGTKTFLGRKQKIWQKISLQQEKNLINPNTFL